VVCLISLANEISRTTYSGERAQLRSLLTGCGVVSERDAHQQGAADMPIYFLSILS